MEDSPASPLLEKMLSRRLHILDALVFSLAAYENQAEKIDGVLNDRYDLPVGSLRLLDDRGVSGPHPFIVGSSSNGYITVACRGTADLADFCQDVKVFHRRLPVASSDCSAHQGFVERAQAIDIGPFLRAIKRGYRIVFTGHSLGGAVASLLALRVLEKWTLENGTDSCDAVDCITFGAPLFANHSLARIINSRFKDLFIHVVMKHDFVPKIIPLVSFTQRILGRGTQDHLELLRFGRFALRLFQEITSLPVASAIDSLEDKLPPPVRMLLKGAVRLLCPDNSQVTYAFAGHIVMLNPYENEPRRRLDLARPEDLNSDVRKLRFALELNISMFADHGLSNYYMGVKNGMFSGRVPHAISFTPEASPTNPIAAGSGTVPPPDSTDPVRFPPDSCFFSTDSPEPSPMSGVSDTTVEEAPSHSGGPIVLRSSFYTHTDEVHPNFFSRLGWLAGTIIRIARNLHSFKTSFILLSVGKAFLTNSLL